MPIKRSHRPLPGRLFIAPYKLGSESARSLAEALGCHRVDGTKIFRPNDVLINWGNSSLSPRGYPKIINSAIAISRAANKVASFQHFKEQGVPSVEWTTDKDVAKLWLDKGHTVYGRKKVSAHSGEGICILTYDNRSWDDCRLYTKGVLKAHEYRVHVFNNNIIDVQKKRRRSGTEGSDMIKNLANGWVFCRDDVAPPYALYDACIKAVASLGLSFGAVDVLYKERDNKVYVLEVNTSPGLQGETLESYKNVINKLLRSNI